MKQLRKVSKVEKVVFPVFVVLFCSLLLPSVAPLLGMLMLGNLFRESGVVERLSDTAQNALCNIVTLSLIHIWAQCHIAENISQRRLGKDKSCPD